MKILHALPSLNRGGTERLVLTLAGHQQQQGHQVVVATFSPLNLWPEESAGLHIEVFNCTFATHRLLRPPLHDAESFVAFLLKWQPDVIHSHSHWTERIVLACPLQRSLLLQHFHLEYLEWLRPKWYQLRSRMGRWQLCIEHLRRGTSFLAVSQATKAYYLRCLPAPLLRRLYCLPNFLALSVRDNVRPNPNLPIRLLSVGRLVPEKQHRRLLLLAKELSGRDIPFELAIAGDGPLREQLEADIDVLGLAGLVKCCGNQMDMVQCYDSADLLLHPATSEPFGLVILEAMARGLPCLVETLSRGVHDFLRHDCNGILISFKDPSAVADEIVCLLEHPKRYRNLVLAGLDTAKYFSLESYWDKLQSFYGLLGDARVGPRGFFRLLR